MLSSAHPSPIKPHIKKVWFLLDESVEWRTQNTRNPLNCMGLQYTGGELRLWVALSPLPPDSTWRSPEESVSATGTDFFYCGPAHCVALSVYPCIAWHFSRCALDPSPASGKPVWSPACLCCCWWHVLRPNHLRMPLLRPKHHRVLHLRHLQPGYPRRKPHRHRPRSAWRVRLWGR